MQKTSPFPFLWSIDGSFDRRRWPPRQIATAVEELDSFQFHLSSFDDKRPVVMMDWVVVVDVNGGFSLRIEWALKLDGPSN